MQCWLSSRINSTWRVSRINLLLTLTSEIYTSSVSLSLTTAEQDLFRHLLGNKSWLLTDNSPREGFVIISERTTLKPLWINSQASSVAASRLHNALQMSTRKPKFRFPRSIIPLTSNILREGGFSPLAPTPLQIDSESAILRAPKARKVFLRAHCYSYFTRLLTKWSSRPEGHLIHHSDLWDYVSTS